MRIGVGSGNPVKRRAVEQALGIATESGPGADPRDAESSLLDGLPPTTRRRSRSRPFRSPPV